jgi:alcohol dehydrogenase
MKAAQLVKYGGSDAITFTDAATQPSIKPDQVLVTVHAAGVNPFDWKVREGFMKDSVDLSLPAIIGSDVAGVVEAVGSDVTDIAVGDEVYGQAGALSANGAFAEFAPVNRKALTKKPVQLTFVEAAALPTAAISALEAIIDHIQLEKGQKILIHGAAGGIGSFAVQIAKAIGGYVAATAGTDDVDFIKSLGADEVIDYKNQDFTKIITHYDAALDTVGGETYQKTFEVVRPGGKLVSMVEQPDGPLMEDYGVIASLQSTDVKSEKLDELVRRFNTLKITIDKTFPLEQTAQALEYAKNNKRRGKVIIQIKS